MRFIPDCRPSRYVAALLACAAVLWVCAAPLAQRKADATQPSYVLDAEGFIRDWLIAGPYPNPLGEPEPKGYAADLLKHLGGEAKFEPYEGFTDQVEFAADKGKLMAGIGSTNEWGFTETKKMSVAWTPVHWTDKDPIISLDGRLGHINDWLVTFAACWVESPDDRSVQLRVGSDDGYKLYLNHELLGGLSMSRAVAKDQNIHQGQLRKGLNLILLKVEERTGAHGFCLRITDRHGDPCTDLRVVTDDPKRRLASACRNVGQVDVIQGRGFARVRLGEEPRFPGKMKLSILLGLTEAMPCEVVVLATDSANRPLFSRTTTADLSPNKAIPIEAEVEVARPGPATVGVMVKDADGKAALAHLSRAFDVLDPQWIVRRRDELRRTLAEREERKKALTQRLGELTQQGARLKAEVAKRYSAIEEVYAHRRAMLAKRYGRDARSINEPFVPDPSPRARLCLNGDGWEMAAATPREGYYKVDDSNPPKGGWEPSWAPMMAVEKYFRYYFFPVVGEGGPYGPSKQMKCAPPGWKLSDIRIGGGVWHRTTIRIPERWRGRCVFFETEYVWQRLKVFLDGRLCGAQSGWPGAVRIALPKASPGEHELLVLTQRAASTGDRPPLQEEFWGLVGDVCLAAVSDVSVTDTWVITSWRNATIEARVWVTNHGDREHVVSVECQAVRAGRTRLRAGSKDAIVQPGQTVELRFLKRWIEAETWGIGGKYGPPNLYHMVTTVREHEKSPTPDSARSSSLSLSSSSSTAPSRTRTRTGGADSYGSDRAVLDQHFTRFGFREFWKEGFHFYLNGKRVFIQGDNVGGRVSSRTQQVLWQHLLRSRANINTVRTHFELQQGEVACVADELGMFLIPQWYAVLDLPGREKPLPLEEFVKTDQHRENLRLYENWVKWLRNHPSVIIYSTDNEIFTQSWDTPDKLDTNLRNDRLGAIYGRYVKELDLTRLVTRDGDEGTWGKTGKWREDPPADIANYHYPDFNTRDLVENWESTYEKPVLFGETLYSSYGAWDGWIDAIPTQVAAKARRVRTVLSLYRDLEISGWVGMGIGLDGFTEVKEDGSGNPWRVTNLVRAEYQAKEQIASLPRYPYFPIEWPSLSGPGLKPEFHRFMSVYGYGSVNAYFREYPVAVLNAVNAAYKESTQPMPPLAPRRPTEALITVTAKGKPVPFAWVSLVPKSGQGTSPIGVRADSKGRAWFVLEEPGAYEARVEGRTTTIMLKLRELPFEMRAGFGYVPRIALEVEG